MVKISQLGGQGWRAEDAWAEMLARVGLKNDRLASALTRRMDRRPFPRPMVEQLEKERGRIARELHAGAGQPLAGIKFNLDLLEKCSDSLPAEGREALRRLRILADTALAEVRAVSHRLHPPDWQDLPIDRALHKLVEESAIALKCETKVQVADISCDPPIYVKTALYRCAQECISNISRHSGATALRIDLTAGAEWMELSIADNGRGLPADAATHGIGLQAIREHAAAASGAVRFATGAAGTKVSVRIPVSEE